MEPDVVGTAEWLSEIITGAVAADKNLSDYTIPLGDGRLALISPEGPAVYLVTVQAAEFKVAESNQDTKGSP